MNKTTKKVVVVLVTLIFIAMAIRISLWIASMLGLLVIAVVAIVVVSIAVNMFKKNKAQQAD